MRGPKAPDAATLSRELETAHASVDTSKVHYSSPPAHKRATGLEMRQPDRLPTYKRWSAIPKMLGSLAVRIITSKTA